MKKHNFFYLIFFLGYFFQITQGLAQGATIPFITEWVASGGSITIPINPYPYAYTYSYNITYQQISPTIESPITISGQQTNSYTIVGLTNGNRYEVRITGQFPHFYMNNNVTEQGKLRSIKQWGNQVWKSMASSFGGCFNLTYNAVDVPNLSNVTSMFSMFSYCIIFNGNIGNWNTTNVTDMSRMFQEANTFNQPLNNWNTSNVLNMRQMFMKATSFNQPLDNWITDKVTHMNWMFAIAVSFNQDLSNWKTNQVTNMKQMFWNASSFNQNLGIWKITNVLSMDGMLNSCGLSMANYDATLISWANQPTQNNIVLSAGGLEYCLGEPARNFLVNIKGWNILGDSYGCKPFITTWRTSDGEITIPTFTGETYNYSVTYRQIAPTVGNPIIITGQTGNCTISNLVDGNIYEVSISGTFPRFFMGWNNPDKNKILTIEQWGTQAWTSMNEAFYQCFKLTYNATDAPNLTNVTDLSFMFADCVLFNGNVGNWDTSNITDMSFLFSRCLPFNQDLSNWNTDKVTNMNQMFVVSSFNHNISNWNTESVTNMRHMFQNTPFNQAIGTWETGKVTDMRYMFCNTPFNQDISGWNTSKVIDMTGMFDANVVFNQPIGGWNTSKVQSMAAMFSHTTAFNQDISQWDTQNVINMRYMFQYAIYFNQDISQWKTDNVTDMNGTFLSAKSFNQSLGDWNVANVTAMFRMLDKSGLLKDNYDKTLTGWASQSVQSNVDLGSLGLNYCSSNNERTSLINNYGWTISGDNFDCNAARPVVSSVSNPNEIITKEVSEKINIYPNPSQGNFNIELPKNTKKAPYTIYNAQGSEVLKGILEDTKNQLKTNLTSGIYLIHILENSKTTIKKIVVE